MSAAAPRTLVHIVDDDPAVLRALSRLLRAAGHAVATHANAEDFFARAERGRGCAVLDLSLPGTDGLAIQARLAREPDAIPVIFLTGRGDIPSSVRAMKGGAIDFLTKPAEPEALIEAVGRALALDRAAGAARAGAADFAACLDALTVREREVLDLVVAGQLNKQIAAELGIAEKTIKVHRARVMRKMKARTLADLVRRVVARAG